MVRTTPTLIVASLVLLAAGAAAANGLLAGPPVGLAVNNGSVVAQTTPGTATTPSTVGPSTGTSGTVGTTPGTTTGTTNGTIPGTTNGTIPNGTIPNGTTGGTLAIDQVVSITRSVPPGPPVAAFTVPAGQQLVITDVLVTNPGTAAACGAQVRPNGTLTATPGTSEAGTGVLCVPAQTSLNLGLTTGLEFAAGQGVVLANATTTDTGTPAALHYHLRGFLMSAS